MASFWQDFKDRLNQPLLFTVYETDTMATKGKLRLRPKHIVLLCMAAVLLLVGATALVIMRTPIREYIPGYADEDIMARQYELNLKLKRLEDLTARQDSFIRAYQRASGIGAKADTSALPESPNEAEVERMYTESMRPSTNLNVQAASYNLADEPIANVPDFVWPVQGLISNYYDTDIRHYAIDMVGKENAVVRATAEGYVILAEFSAETGYIIGIQHAGGWVSFYKHNSLLLKRVGDIAYAHEPIAFVGNSGTHTTGPHLHFELWHNGYPVDPLKHLPYTDE